MQPLPNQSTDSGDAEGVGKRKAQRPRSYYYCYADGQISRWFPPRRGRRSPCFIRHVPSASPLVFRRLRSQLLRAKLLGPELHGLGAEGPLGLSTLGLRGGRAGGLGLSGRNFREHVIEGVVIVAPAAFALIGSIVEAALQRKGEGMVSSEKTDSDVAPQSKAPPTKCNSKALFLCISFCHKKKKFRKCFGV